VTIGAALPVPPATDSIPGHRDRVVMTTEDGRINRRVTVSTLVRRRHAATVIRVDLVRPAPLATDDPAPQRVPGEIGATLPRIDGLSDATTISADNVRVSRTTGRHALVMIVTVIDDVPQAGRSSATIRVGQRVEGRLRAGSGVTGLLAHREEVLAQPVQEARVAAQAGHHVAHARVQVVRDRAHDATTTSRQVEQEVAVSDRRMTIAIDGPAAAGKSTVGEIVAQKIDGVYFDTGLLYRALTLLAIDNDIAPVDETGLANLAATMDIQIGRPSVDDGRQADVLLNGRDVTHALRTPAIDRNVSAVSAHEAVRAALLEQQRRIGRSGTVVMVGRDIGTVVLPDAELKVFLDASPEERARRRCLQLDEMGRQLPYDQILADMIRRDRIDSERDVAPLKPASDAIIIDSDRLSIEEVAAVIVGQVQQRLGTACG
jgi:cytidylate kinase